MVAIIAACGAAYQSWLNGQAQYKDAKIKDEKLQEIHVLVNSRLSEALAEIATLRKSVALLTGKPGDKVAAMDAATDAKREAGK